MDLTNTVIQATWANSSDSRKQIGDFLQHQWEKLYDYYQGDEFSLATQPAAIVGFPLLLLAALPFMIVDYFNWPKWMASRKLQPTKHQSTSYHLFKCFLLVGFNFTVTNYFFHVTLYYLGLYTGCSNGRTLPTVEQAICRIGFTLVQNEFMFFFIHYTMHHKWLYSWSHKRHHEFTSPFALAAYYVTPIEYYIVSLGGFFGLIITGSHLSEMWLCEFLANTFITIQHSGYLVTTPGFGSFSAHHDYHHEKFTFNYSTFGIADVIAGTKHKTYMSIQEKMESEKDD